MDNFGEQAIFSELEQEQLFSATMLDYPTNAYLPLYTEQAHDLYSSPYSPPSYSPTREEFALTTEHFPYVNSHTPNTLSGGVVGPSMTDPSQWGGITPTSTRGPILRLQTQYHMPHGLLCGRSPDLGPSSVLPHISGVSPSVSQALTPSYANIDPRMSYVMPTEGSMPAPDSCTSSSDADGNTIVSGFLDAPQDHGYDFNGFVDSQSSITSRKPMHTAVSPIQSATPLAQSPSQDSCISSSPDGDPVLLEFLGNFADYDIHPCIDSHPSITSTRRTHKAISPIQPATLLAPPPIQDSCVSSPDGETALLGSLGIPPDHNQSFYACVDSQPSIRMLTHKADSPIQPAISLAQSPTQDSCASSPNGHPLIVSRRLTHTAVPPVHPAIFPAQPPDHDSRVSSPNGDIARSGSLDAVSDYDRGSYTHVDWHRLATSTRRRPTHTAASHIGPAILPAQPPAQNLSISSPSKNPSLSCSFGAIPGYDYGFNACVDSQSSIESRRLTRKAMSPVQPATLLAPPPAQDSCASSRDGDTAQTSLFDAFANCDLCPRVDSQSTITSRRLTHAVMSPPQSSAQSNGIHKGKCSPLQRQTRAFWCQWLTDGAPCEVRVVADRRKVFEHLQRDHGIKPGDEKSRQTCLWKGCTAIMNKESLARHIWSVHLKEKAHCAECGLHFAREDSLKRHLKGSQHKGSCDSITLWQDCDGPSL